MNKTITIGGNAYTLTPINLSTMRSLLAHAKKAMPCPVAQLLEVANMLPDELRKDYINRNIDKASERKRAIGAWNDPDTQTFLQTEGQTKLFASLFRDKHPNLTEEQCEDLACQAIAEGKQEELAEMFTASTKVPMKEEDVERNFFRKSRVSKRKA